jgi:hypothetical protein
LTSEVAFPHGCQELARAVEDDALPVTYLPKFREYGIRYLDGGTSFHVMSFCPFDGQALPSSTRDAYVDVLAELALEPGDPGIPAEFTDDSWWRSRGL